MSDALSELYLGCCVLKRFEDDGCPESDRPIVDMCLQNALYRCQQALGGAIDNFPNLPVRWLLRLAVFPLGRPYRPASDRLASACVRLATEPGEVRNRLTREIFVSRDPNDPTGILEVTLEKVVAAEEAERKLERAIRQGLVRRFHGIDWIGDAVTKGVLTSAEGDQLREVEALTQRVIAVDHFDPDEVRPHYMTAGHNVTSAGSVAAQ
jgi:acyl-CoA dehydrogenase